MRKPSAKIGFPLKKRLGQHLLINPNILRRIVETARIGASDPVIEIGTGDGRLTELLARAARKVISFEIDPRFKPIHKKELGSLRNLKIIYSDFLGADLIEIVRAHSLENLKFVGNIPYNITAPLIMKILESGVSFSGLYFTVQKEVAERIVGRPGTKAYGIFGLKVIYFCDPKIEIEIPRTNFKPVPKVDSAFISLVPRAEKYLNSEKQRKRFFRFLEKAFSHRRKTLLNSLKAAGEPTISIENTEQFLEKIGKPKNIRAEALSMKELLFLFGSGLSGSG